MARKKSAAKPIFKVGDKVSKKRMVEYHGNHQYRWWDAEVKEWVDRTLADKLPKGMVVTEIRENPPALVFVVTGNDAKVVWVEITKGKSAVSISRPNVIPLNTGRAKV